MKRLLPLLLLVFLFPLPRPSRNANAEEVRYACAARTDVWFYAAENKESGLFLLPYTYYVRVVREGVLFTAVEYLDDVAPYKSIAGFCRTEQLTFVDFVPERPFLKREIEVDYTIAGEPLMGSGSFDCVRRSFVFYGESYAGTARFFYVYADGVFDYIPATQEILYDLNTDYLAPPASEEVPAEEPAPAPSGMLIAVVCVAAFLVLTVALFLLRKRRPVLSQDPEF